MKIGISKDLTHKIMRLFLRSVPIIPAPELYDIFINLKESNKNINDKIEKAYTSLKETSELITELQTDLTDRTEKVKKLKDEYEQYSKLADIEADKAKVFLNQLSKTVNKGKNAERLISFIINIIAGILLFILGIWLGPKISNLLSSNSHTEQVSP